MEMIGCTCDDLPAHDHFMGHHEVDGVWQARYDRDDIGRVWVDWRKVARALLISPHPAVAPDVDLIYRQLIIGWRRLADELGLALERRHEHCSYQPHCHACDALVAWKSHHERSTHA